MKKAGEAFPFPVDEKVFANGLRAYVVHYDSPGLVGRRGGLGRGGRGDRFGRNRRIDDLRGARGRQRQRHRARAERASQTKSQQRRELSHRISLPRRY